ncbi:DUF6708 domain-containing protein, partial [Atlantibacter hermannii]
MDNKKSRLVKPVRGWSEDLPDPEEEQRVYPRLIRVNEINDVWMEIPRYVNHGWGGVWFAGFVGLASFAFLFPLFILSGFFFQPVGLLLIFVFFSFIVMIFRTVLFAARGAPVRFNRKQQKVYVYEQKRSIWPWWKWPVEIKVFDWAD